MILLTGGTGLVGGAVMRKLLDQGRPVRAFVRDPRRLGTDRVRVQIALGDLADPHSYRNALRGVESVVHLAAAVRDQPRGSVEELNGLGTMRLLQLAEQAGVERFVFFSALNASPVQRTRFFRAKALAEEAVLASDLATTVFAPSIVYAYEDRWISLLRRLSMLPLLPVSGAGTAVFQPIWADDVADCVVAGLDRGPGRFELAGPEVLSYSSIARLVALAAGRERRLLHVPLPVVRRLLLALRRLVGPYVFATWEEAELLEVSMTTPHGPRDVRELGVEPRPIGDVLGVP